MATATRNREAVARVIDPRCMYDTEGACLATGYGEDFLRESRAEGQLRGYWDGHRMRYLGADLIEFIIERSEVVGKK